MGRANPDNCSHPLKSQSTPTYGHLSCGRCGADTTDAARRFTVRHSERVTLSQGDRVAVRGGGAHGSAFQGIFQWAETFPSGEAYLIAEVQMYQHQGTWYEGWAAQRFIRPEFVRQAPGVRNRNKRKEVNA